MIDAIVAEPLGGAHRGPTETMAALGDALERSIAQFGNEDGDTLRRLRREKFLEMGKQGLG